MAPIEPAGPAISDLVERTLAAIQRLPCEFAEFSARARHFIEQDEGQVEFLARFVFDLNSFYHIFCQSQDLLMNAEGPQFRTIVQAISLRMMGTHLAMATRGSCDTWGSVSGYLKEFCCCSEFHSSEAQSVFEDCEPISCGLLVCWVPKVTCAWLRERSAYVTCDVVDAESFSSMEVQRVLAHVRLHPEDYSFPKPVICCLDTRVHSDALMCLRSLPDGTYERLFCSFTNIGHPYVSLDHFCEIGFVEQKLPPGFKHFVQFETWVSRTPQLTGEHSIVVLCVPQLCAHCRHEAVQIRQFSLASRGFLPCSDSVPTMKLKSCDGSCGTGDSFTLSYDNEILETIEFDFREGVTSHNFPLRVNPDTPRAIIISKQEASDSKRKKVERHLRIDHPSRLQAPDIGFCLVVYAMPELSDMGKKLQQLALQPEELRAIQQFDAKATVLSAARLEDIRDALVKTQPEILHITCHGSGSALLLHDCKWSRQAAKVDVSSLCDLLKEHLASSGARLRCVFLNVCDSNQQAQAVFEVGVENVIFWARATEDCLDGTSSSKHPADDCHVRVLDSSALAFAQAFYGLCERRTSGVHINYDTLFHGAVGVVASACQSKPAEAEAPKPHRVGLPTYYDRNRKSGWLKLGYDHHPSLLTKHSQKVSDLVGRVRDSLA